MMWSVHAMGFSNPMLKLKCSGHEIEWVNSYKYLSYWMTTELDYGIKSLVVPKLKFVNKPLWQTRLNLVDQHRLYYIEFCF